MGGGGGRERGEEGVRGEEGMRGGGGCASSPLKACAIAYIHINS